MRRVDGAADVAPRVDGATVFEAPPETNGQDAARLPVIDPGGSIDSSKYVADLLREARRLHGWTLVEAAAASGGRFKPSTLSAYERGNRRVTATALHDLARLYGTPVGALLPPSDAEGDTLLLERIGRLPPAHRELLAALVERMFDDTRPAAEPPPPAPQQG